MRKWIPLAVLLAVLLTGCDNEIVWPWECTAPAAEPSATVELTPEVTPIPTPTPTPTPTPSQTPTPTPIPTPTPEPYDYSEPVQETETAVSDEWFENAVFVGDSRTDGLRLYSGIKGVDFLSYKGLTVFEVMSDKPVILSAEGKVGILQALAKKDYAKVYISLGVNELGYNHDQGFADTYRSMVDKVRELQPDADIYLQMLIPINTQKCKETKQMYYVTNEQIAIYNGIIEEVAAEKQVYLLNVGEIFVDENGELPYEASFDGIHFNRDGYKTWLDYLKTHTVEEDVA